MIRHRVISRWTWSHTVEVQWRVITSTACSDRYRFLLAYCAERGIHITWPRAYKKNDRARIEQKNGAVVHKPVG
jgi:hypothetical protein